MLEHLYLILAIILDIEIFIRSGFISHLNAVVATARKASHIILEPKIGDHWKEKIVPAYAFIILKNSLLILVILLAAILVFFSFSLLSNRFITFFLSVMGILESIVIAFVYLKLRNLLVK